MKTIFKLSVAALMMLPLTVSAQKNSDPEGVVTYSLPSTTIMLDVEAVQESFYAGPYAKYAEKYLGIDVRQNDETMIQLTQVKMYPRVEADHNRRYSLTVNKGQIDGTFLKLTSAGLISFADAKYADASVWRFPTTGQGDFSAKGVSSNLTSASTTLYRNGGKSAVKQNMLVGKTPEQKAAEAADMIIKLRKQRLQIVTGDTDATYSGEAMGAAIAELTRLEQEYMTLFTGYSEFQTQQMTFEVFPEPSNEEQAYVAFRLSDTEGIVPADNLYGKPVILQIMPQQFTTPEAPVVEESSKKKEVEVLAHYRIPVVCTVKLMDAANLLLQTRMPIYQLGQESSLPVNVILK